MTSFPTAPLWIATARRSGAKPAGPPADRGARSLRGCSRVGPRRSLQWSLPRARAACPRHVVTRNFRVSAAVETLLASGGRRLGPPPLPSHSTGDMARRRAGRTCKIHSLLGRRTSLLRMEESLAQPSAPSVRASLLRPVVRVRLQYYSHNNITSYYIMILSYCGFILNDSHTSFV